jgi:hypothetical protein
MIQFAWTSETRGHIELLLDSRIAGEGLMINANLIVNEIPGFHLHRLIG